jgi:hypothetical protein
VENKYLKLVKKGAQGILLSLSIEFVLGMILNLWAATPDDPTYLTEPIFLKIIFVIHSINGLILLIASVALLIIAFKSGKSNWKNMSMLGFMLILFSAVGGMLATGLKSSGAEVGSFIMAIDFLASFFVYTKMYINSQEVDLKLK